MTVMDWELGWVYLEAYPLTAAVKISPKLKY